MRRALWVAVVGCFLASACGDQRKEEPPAPPPAPKPEGMEVFAFCETVLGAPKRSLEARCNADEKQQPAFAYLASIADARVADCKRRLEPDVNAARIFLGAAKARACAARLEKASWKDTLMPAAIARFPECRDLVRGIEKEDGPCRYDARCLEGLACEDALVDEDGKCVKRVKEGEPCKAGIGLAWIDGWNSTCESGLTCTAARASTIVTYPLGLESIPPIGAPSASGGNRFGIEGPTDSPDPHIARQQALEEAQRLQIIGALTAAAGGEPGGGIEPGGPARGLDCVIRGLPIELGPLTAEQTGFGGRGRRGEDRSTVPRVKQGATNVSGRLPPEVIRRIVRQNFGRFRLCYENGLRNNPELAGQIRVSFVIAPDGSVADVSSTGDMPDGAVVSCVERSFFGLSFPSPESGNVRVTFPLRFEPADKPDGADIAAPAEPPPADVDAGVPSVPEVIETGFCEAAGEGCRASSECDGGTYCTGSPSGPAKCVPRKPAGEPCGSSLECAGICSAEGKCASFCAGAAQ
jgi:hypothetical protein